MHGHCCPCIVFFIGTSLTGPLRRPDAGSEIFSQQTPHDSPRARRTERKFRMPPCLSGSSFRDSGYERERPYRPPQPAESDGCIFSSQSKKSVVAAFRKFPPLTASDLRHAPKSHLPAAVSAARKSAWGRPRSARFFTCGNTSPNETQRRDTSRNEKSPRPKPLRTASYRYGGRPPQSDVPPPSGSAVDRRKSRKRPHSATTHPPAGRAEDSPRRKAGARSIRRRNELILRRTYTVERRLHIPACRTAVSSPPPDVFRSRSVRTRTDCGRERVQSGNAACGCASGHSNPKNAIGHVDPSKHILSVFPLRRLCLFVFNNATIRRGGFGGHPVNG